MGAVEISDVRKSYGAVEVLKGIDLAIADGEFVVLVGASGCGKSTLLRMIAGLEEITAGEIGIDGRVVNDLAPKERDIAMVFQNYALYPHMTVRQNMAFSMRLRRASMGDRDKAVERAASILNLEPLLDRFPKELSGGQRQRVAMGRAIIRDPQVFLFDEPLSNLDAKLRVHMRAEIKELHQRLKTTTIYVTHDQIEAMTMADRIVVMNGGRIEQAGAPLDLYDRPVNRYVAGFIGSPAMNFVDGTIAAGGQPVFESAGGWRVELPAGINAHAGQPVTLGIRPEDVMLETPGETARIRVVEPTGSETQVIADFHGEEITCLVRDRMELRPGDRLALRCDMEKLHLFDRESGRNVGITR
ncbi:MAG: ABC transporter ATP-binding protein [Tropicimonas sp.]|uniref:ABC transporter ATP-binding protein n=1 Tax=Tropicimonas sp. TaxID=2067044 RepID=UPI003A89F9B2